jgi:hypothetical protein
MNFVMRIGNEINPVVVFNGDIIEVDAKNRTQQTITRNKATIMRMAAECLDPMINGINTYYFVRGTPAHVGKSAQYEEELAADLDPIKCGKAFTWRRLYIKVESVRLDIAHYASLSGLPYGIIGAAERMAQKIVLSYHDSGDVPPHLVIRSHNHKFADSTSLHATRAIYTGSFCLPTEYSEQLGYDLADIGGLIIRIDGSKYEAEPVRYKPKGRQWQRL